jgi:hypothetical protein
MDDLWVGIIVVYFAVLAVMAVFNLAGSPLI